jgi:hypothetical protein
VSNTPEVNTAHSQKKQSLSVVPHRDVSLLIARRLNRPGAFSVFSHHTSPSGTLNKRTSVPSKLSAATSIDQFPCGFGLLRCDSVMLPELCADSTIERSSDSANEYCAVHLPGEHNQRARAPRAFSHSSDSLNAFCGGSYPLFVPSFFFGLKSEREITIFFK